MEESCHSKKPPQLSLILTGVNDSHGLVLVCPKTSLPSFKFQIRQLLFANMRLVVRNISMGYKILKNFDSIFQTGFIRTTSYE